MSSGQDLLPKSVNDFLDEVDAFLCLPVLVGMILCTLQFIFNHVLSIGCTLYQNIKDNGGSGRKYAVNSQPVAGIIDKLKDMLGRLPFGNMINASSREKDLADLSVQEEDWDYCDEDVEC